MIQFVFMYVRFYVCMNKYVCMNLHVSVCMYIHAYSVLCLWMDMYTFTFMRMWSEMQREILSWMATTHVLVDPGWWLSHPYAWYWSTNQSFANTGENKTCIKPPASIYQMYGYTSLDILSYLRYYCIPHHTRRCLMLRIARIRNQSWTSHKVHSCEVGKRLWATGSITGSNGVQHDDTNSMVELLVSIMVDNR